MTQPRYYKSVVSPRHVCAVQEIKSTVSGLDLTGENELGDIST